MTRSSLLAFAASCLFLLHATDIRANGNLLQNGSFEETSGTSPLFWNPSGNLAVIGSQGETDGDLALAFSFGNLPSNGFISQEVATVAGQAYELTFDFGKFSVNQPDQVARLEIDVFDSTAVAGFGGPIILSTLLEDASPGPGTSAADATVYDPFEFIFIATGTSTTLRFGDLSDAQVAGGGFDAMLDNVVLRVIPEPSTIFLAASMTGLLMPVRRREL